MARSLKNRTRENQHYVPRFLLNKFCSEQGASTIIDAYDKLRLIKFRANTTKVASEIDFNAISISGKRISLEDGYTTIEDAAAPVVAKILATRTLTSLDSVQRYALAIFTGSLFFRSKRAREDIKAIGARAKEIVAINFGEEYLSGDLRKADTDEYAKKMASYIHFEQASNYAKLLLEKDWLLIQPDKAGSFLISDNPVVMHNDNDFGPYGNLGLKIRGVYSYMPLAPDLVIAFWCPSIRERLLRTFAESFEGLRMMEYLKNRGADKLDGAIEHNYNEYTRSIFESYCYINSIESGDACIITEKARMHINILQVYFSTRFTFGTECAAKYIDEYLERFPEARNPFKVRVS